MRLQRMLLLAVVLVLFPLASVDTGLAAAEPATDLRGTPRCSPPAWSTRGG